jgi:hypothetical protein
MTQPQPQPPSAIWPRTGVPARDNPADDGAGPRLVRSAGDVRIVEFRGRYFGVPQYLGPLEQVDLTRPDAIPAGVLVADSDAALEAEIEYVARWANSRGQIDAQESRSPDDTPFRAGSALGEHEISVLASGYTIVRGRGEVYAIKSQDLAQLGRPEHAADDGRKTDAAVGVTVSSAISEGALTQALGIVNDYMILFLDHMFYAIPRLIMQAAARDKRLAGLPLHQQPGVIAGPSYPDVLNRIGWRRERRLRSGATAPGKSPATAGLGDGRDQPAGGVPRIVRSLQGYDIIAYEGWFYGVPQSLGPVDLTQTDALSLPGIIADVAQTSVETEIADRASAGVKPIPAA